MMHRDGVAILRHGVAARRQHGRLAAPVADPGRALAQDAADVGAASRGTGPDHLHEGRRPVADHRVASDPQWPANMASLTLADEEDAGLWHVMSGDPA